MKSYVAKPAEIERKWFVIDAEGKTFGRLASEVASILRGKRKPIYTPHTDTGDFVIVINIEKVVFTGKKLEDKMYRWHTGFPGGLKERTYGQMMEKHPERLFSEAVAGMLPKNSLGKQMAKKLKVYKGAEHKHEAQQPEVLELNI